MIQKCIMELRCAIYIFAMPHGVEELSTDLKL